MKYSGKAQYHMINLLTIAIIVGLVWHIHASSIHIECVYKKEGLKCSSCGLTRSIKKAMVMDFDGAKQINEDGVNLSVFFLFILISRAIVSVLLLKLEDIQKVCILDITFVFSLFIFLCSGLLAGTMKSIFFS